MDLAQQLLVSLADLRQRQPHAAELVVAFSGGRDSSVLLDLCVRTSQSLPISAIHVNHGLHEQADDWQAHCERVCADHRIKLTCLRVSVPRNDADGLESAARRLRYQAMESVLQPGQVLLTAHHADDQAETVLLNLLRGSGARGLSGMPLSRPLGNNILYRPLLGCPSAAIESYAQQRALVWINDHSNEDSRFSRNFIRNKVAPLLASRWSDWSAQVLASAAINASVDGFVQSHFTALLRSACRSSDQSLCINHLQGLTAAEQPLLLRQWLYQQSGQWAGRTVLAELQNRLIPAAQDRIPEVQWRGGVIRRFHNRLYFCRPLPVIDKIVDTSVWPGPTEQHFKALELPGNGVLSWQRTDRNGMRCPASDYKVVYRDAVKRLALAGRPHRPLKKILQESGVPPWLRERVPILLIDGKPAAIAGVGICEGFAAEPDECAWQLVWTLPSSN